MCHESTRQAFRNKYEQGQRELRYGFGFAGRTVILFGVLGFGIPGFVPTPFDCFHQVVRAETGRQEHIGLNGDYVKGYVSNTKAIITSPMHWKGAQWKEALLIVGITAAIYPLDPEVKEEVQEGRNSASNRLAGIARHFGEGQYVAAPLGVLYLYGHFKGDDTAEETALLSVESLAVSGLFTGAVKNLSHRNRPSSGYPFDVWHGPELSLKNLSFPSGHSAAAFSLATVVASEYANNGYIPPAAYGIATLTALSRVNDNAHWTMPTGFPMYFSARRWDILPQKLLSACITTRKQRYYP